MSEDYESEYQKKIQSNLAAAQPTIECETGVAPPEKMKSGDY